MSNTARAVTFYLLAIGMCAALALAFPRGELSGVLAMFAPTLGVLVMHLVVTRDGWRREGWASLGLGRLGARYLPVALALPIAIPLLSEVAVRLTGLTSWHMPSGADTAELVLLVPVMLVFCFGEELGWRGYLGPLLVADGRPLPHVRTGLLHGIWHLPLVFLATGAYLTDGNHWVIVPIFLGVFACSGPVYGWLREVSGSVYPAVVAHASFNMSLVLIASTVTTTNPDLVAALGREAGIATLVVLAVVAVWVSTWDRTGPVTSPKAVTASHQFTTLV